METTQEHMRRPGEGEDRARGPRLANGVVVLPCNVMLPRDVVASPSSDTTTSFVKPESAESAYSMPSKLR